LLTIGGVQRDRRGNIAGLQLADLLELLSLPRLESVCSLARLLSLLFEARDLRR
jgi:hypothetical protein